MGSFTYMTWKVLTDTPLKDEPSLSARTSAMVPKNRLFIVLGENEEWLTTAYGYIQKRDCAFAFSYEEEI